MAAGRASAAASDRNPHRAPPCQTFEKAGQGACLYPLRGIAVVIQKNWQELIKPNKLEVAQGDDPKRVATLVAEPLERGFGTTLGNALRRVLLSLAGGRGDHLASGSRTSWHEFSSARRACART